MYNYFKQTSITDFSDQNIDTTYQEGFVATRLGKGIYNQLDSVRVPLESFKPNSENRRILRKSENLEVRLVRLADFEYNWKIGKLAKDFYDTKFEKGIISANKVKEMFTDSTKSNMNAVFVFTQAEKTIGYCLAVETKNMVHYSYPFYDLREITDNSMGMAMMVHAIMLAKELEKQYIYLGSYKKYKMQFDGVEVFLESEEWVLGKEYKMKNT